MFLALDESEENGKKVLGGILLSEKLLPALEADFVSLRVKHKLFAELKWNKIDQYYKRYCEFIDLFFNDPNITYHSICYRRTGDQKYRAAFVLIRTITWKLQNAGINEPLYVLFDNDGSLGDHEAREIKKIAATDRRFKQRLEFCSQGTSHVLGALQLADLLTGAVCSAINGIALAVEPKHVHDHIQAKNNGVPLDWASARLPKLNDLKIHYFDPDNRPTY
jgi:hypothetical protein